METLDQIFTKNGTDKASYTHGYAHGYEKYFECLREKEIVLLEIGVAGGASIRAWREYFPKAKIYGIDNNPDCAGEGIFIGSQTDKAFLISVLKQIGKPDIIIDDGSHVGPDMIGTFRDLFINVSGGGFYAVEDTHCFYNEHYAQGGNPFGFFTELAKHVDVVGRAMTGNQEYAIDHGMTDPPVPEFSRYLKAMHIHPSLWIFERK